MTQVRAMRQRGQEIEGPIGASSEDGAELVLTRSASPAMARVFALVREVAPTDTTVLLTGETGTGKEVIARQIHGRSRRAAQPFVAVNCGALPAPLIESELFGHERGAFSGALDRRIGHFEAAQGGTLLLDEVSEIPLTLQTRLLRVLQEREVQRLGSSRPLPLDVRIIATTNRDLATMVQRGELRKDLYYRLNVFPIALPPLRERKDDIEALVRVLLARLRPTLGPAHASVAEETRPEVRLARETLAALRAYDFPGNVRELANVIERALVMSPDGVIEPEALDLDGGRASPWPGATVPVVGAVRREIEVEALEDVERRLILDALGACRGNRTHAASRLGISVRTLRNKIRALRELGVAVPAPQANGVAARGLVVVRDAGGGSP